MNRVFKTPPGPDQSAIINNIKRHAYSLWPNAQINESAAHLTIYLDLEVPAPAPHAEVADYLFWGEYTVYRVTE
jgi:hypothetical protein